MSDKDKKKSKKSVDLTRSDKLLQEKQQIEGKIVTKIGPADAAKFRIQSIDSIDNPLKEVIIEELRKGDK